MRTALVLTLWLAPLWARGAAIVALDEAEMVRRADTIAFGAIVSTEVRRTPLGPPITIVELSVYRGLRGVADGTTLTFAVPGGAIGGRVVTVSGAPRPVPGELVFGFFETSGEERVPLGLAFGLLDVRPVSGSLRVFRDLAGLQLMRAEGGAADARRHVIAGEPFTEFLGRIEAQVRTLPGPVPEAPDGVLR